VPGLAFAALDTALFHLHGRDAIVAMHTVLAMVAVCVAALRLYQSAAPESVMRGLMLSSSVVAIGGSLWIDALFQ
jgi:hypothetical protein